MMIEKTNINWIPATGEFLHHGWLDLGKGDIWIITDIHSWDDYGATLDTFFIEKDGERKEVYSQDEGETFTLELQGA